MLILTRKLRSGSLEPELLFSLAKKNKIALSADMYSTIEVLKTR